ncbi:MAG: twitching motility protein PilT [Isosphaera sp.]|nr:twitching motility protein PilT [Isosphaera sp.]
MPLCPWSMPVRSEVAQRGSARPGKRPGVVVCAAARCRDRSSAGSGAAGGVGPRTARRGQRTDRPMHTNPNMLSPAATLSSPGVGSAPVAASARAQGADMSAHANHPNSHGHGHHQGTGHVVLETGNKKDPHATRIGDFLKACIKLGASDLIMKAGTVPKLRIRGSLKPLDTAPLTQDEFVQIAKQILSEELWEDLKTYGSADFAYDYDETTRFRVNLFQAKGRLAMAARLITSNIRRFEDLYLPASMSQIAMQPQGIVLLSGVTGSGKSTTIASMLDYVNERKPVHIVTIEDPIEYVFQDKKATINQREIGLDVSDFKVALRALVRENPDIVLVGEMRDKETFEAALHAAETGHLVYGTIHASSTTQTFSRIYGLFESEEVEQVRRVLAYQMRAFVYQKLLPTLHENIARIPALEILIANPVVQKYVLDGREGELREYLRTVEARQQGMVDFNGSLVDLVEREYIHVRVAEEASPNIDELKMRLKKLGGR